MCFLNVVPEKIKPDVRSKLLNQEDLKTIAEYVDQYINTYLKDDQTLYEIRNSQTVDNDAIVSNNTRALKIDHDIKHSVDFLKVELDNQKLVSNELLYEIRKIKNEMPLLINSIKGLNTQDNNYDSSYDRRPRPHYSQERSYDTNYENRNRSQSRGRYQQRNQRDFSRPRYNDSRNNICYGHKKFGDLCFKEKCPPWCQYKTYLKPEEKETECFGHRKYGDKCYSHICPPWCTKNNSKNSKEVPATNQ